MCLIAILTAYLGTIPYYLGKNGVGNITPLLPLILYGSMVILLLAGTLRAVFDGLYVNRFADSIGLVCGMM